MELVQNRVQLRVFGISGVKPSGSGNSHLNNYSSRGGLQRVEFLFGHMKTAQEYFWSIKF